MTKFKVEGMTCGGCARAVTNAVKQVDPAASIDIDLSSKSVAVTSTASTEQLQKAIADAGYEVTA
jgi:copper chaperone